MKKVRILGAAIVDVLVSPADERVFAIGSCPADRPDQLAHPHSGGVRLLLRGGRSDPGDEGKEGP